MDGVDVDPLDWVVVGTAHVLPWYFDVVVPSAWTIVPGLGGTPAFKDEPGFLSLWVASTLRFLLVVSVL